MDYLLTVEDWLLAVDNVLQSFPGDLNRLESICVALCIDSWAALSALHRFQFLHRDIKPSNVMFQPRTKSFVLIDYCQMVSLESASCSFGTFGTPGYDAPELLESTDERVSYSALADVYSLSCTLKKFLTKVISSVPPEGSSSCLLKRLMDIVFLPMTFGTKNWHDRPSADLILNSVLAESKDFIAASHETMEIIAENVLNCS